MLDDNCFQILCRLVSLNYSHEQIATSFGFTLAEFEDWYYDGGVNSPSFRVHVKLVHFDKQS